MSDNKQLRLFPDLFPAEKVVVIKKEKSLMDEPGMQPPAFTPIEAVEATLAGEDFGEDVVALTTTIWDVGRPFRWRG